MKFYDLDKIPENIDLQDPDISLNFPAYDPGEEYQHHVDTLLLWQRSVLGFDSGMLPQLTMSGVTVQVMANSPTGRQRLRYNGAYTFNAPSGVIYYPNQNSSSRGSRPVNIIVFHSTASNVGADPKDVIRYQESSGGTSYHFIIDRDGTVYMSVDPTRTAWHAGNSIGPSGKGVNSYSIGVSFMNKNDGKDPYTVQQYQSAVWLVKYLKQTFPIVYITGHSEVAIPQGRKSDPAGFDMGALARDTNTIFWRRSMLDSK